MDDKRGMAVPVASRRADASALEALVDAAAGILAADSLSDTLARIAHHLPASCSTTTRCRSTRSIAPPAMLVPVYALGDHAGEVMADSFPVTEGVTGWVVSNGRTHNVERADQDPLVAVVAGHRDGARVARLRAAADRGPRRRRDQRVPDRRATSAFSCGRGRAGRALRHDVALAFDSARRRDTLREQARTSASPRCSTTAHATSVWVRRSRAPRRSTCR